ncbi:MAG: hypothetical protein Q8P28_05330 [Deltaproteobacteria bacterium]|nr:hypothetical protein [Deltaproteobacteria bacterium]
MDMAQIREGIKQFFEQAKEWIKQFSEQAGKSIKQFIEQTGVYIFFISIILATQIRWVKRYNRFEGIEIRIILGFLAGLILSLVVIKLIEKICRKFNKDYETFLSQLSIALSPGILFIFGATNKTFRIAGIISCVLVASYMWIKPFRDFIDSLIYIEKFKGILTVKGDKAIIDLCGIYEKANPKAMHAFLTDMLINFYECSEMNINEIKIDFSNLEERSEDELKSIIEPIGRYFNLRIVY